MIDPDRLRRAYQTARRDLLAERVPGGHWLGELSGSALATATATSALAVVMRHAADEHSSADRLGKLIVRGLEYLAGCQNEDGGWGDTDKSLSNIATTMLVRAAFHLAGQADGHRELLHRAAQYIDAKGGIPGLRNRYGKDKTFAVPILANCALAGLVPWREVPPLPFELACFPQAIFRFLRMPVVSYAVPALVAIGQARYVHLKPANPLTRLVRRLAIGGSLKTLRRMQPASGGFLEAAPLTSFVVMSLAGTGRTDHPVVRNGVEFLVRSVRRDGSWPIDTNLAAWVTTLAINALAGAGENVLGALTEQLGDCPDFRAAKMGLSPSEMGKLFCYESLEPGSLDWLLSCQHKEVHPLTNAAPGGWGWTDLSGAVPDADDTSGALLALAVLKKSARQTDVARIDAAAEAGVRWLLDLQNADGGWPTFCRGWGRLPFDRSGADLTAHAIRALDAWQDVSPARINAATGRGFDYLAEQQRADGSWVPLWFGNQHHPSEENPVYGTGRVLLAYRDLDRLDSRPARRGLDWLASNRQPDGGWGGGPIHRGGPAAKVSGVEETAVALEAVISAPATESLQPATSEGLAWLVEAVQSGRYRENAPVGFYFAKLWYYERLYPLIFSVSALGTALRRIGPTPEPDRATTKPRPPETAP